MSKLQGKPGVEFLGDAPKGPHLAAVTDESGLATALPPGAMIHVVEDARDWRKVHRMVLVLVSLKKLVFRCMCNPNCTVVRTYTLREAGRHT